MPDTKMTREDLESILDLSTQPLENKPLRYTSSGRWVEDYQGDLSFKVSSDCNLTSDETATWLSARLNERDGLATRMSLSDEIYRDLQHQCADALNEREVLLAEKEQLQRRIQALVSEEGTIEARYTFLETLAEPEGYKPTGAKAPEQYIARRIERLEAEKEQLVRERDAATASVERIAVALARLMTPEECRLILERAKESGDDLVKRCVQDETR